MREILSVRAYLRYAGKTLRDRRSSGEFAGYTSRWWLPLILVGPLDVMQSAVDYLVNQIVSSWTAADAEPDGDAPEPSPS